MTPIIEFIGSNAVWFYLICAAGFVFFLRKILLARRSASQSLFGLEFEMAQGLQERSMRLLFLSVGMAVLIFVIGNIIEPSLPAYERAAATPTPDIFATPPPTFTSETPTATATLTSTLTAPTAIPQPSAPIATGDGENPTPAPSPTPAMTGACYISSPANGSEIAGEVTLMGTATANQFLFYKLEAFGPQTAGVWASLLGDTVSTPVIDGVLGTANFGGWASGGYSIRLVIVDTTHNEVGGCYVTLTVATP